MLWKMEDTRNQRIEERLAWLEKHVLEQDKAMMELGDEVRRLRKLLQQMHEKMRAGGDGGDVSIPDERPPHY